ncbi:MAG: glycosyltransferase family 39 protein [Mycobacteriales bacterium]
MIAGVLSGPLWLDEVISVEIARLPLPDLYAALRQDGAPPLYYLLLKAWMTLVGTGTVAVRLLTALLVPVALLLAWRLGSRLDGRAGGRAAVIVLATLPWLMRFGSETRMYLLVVVLVLSGALALHTVRTTASRRAVLTLAALAGLLLLTHYWSLFLLTAVGLLHLPGLVRRRGDAVRVVLALGVGGLLFLPWAPTFLFQAAHTGAPWAAPLTVAEFLRTPRYWGGGSVTFRTLLGLLLVPLAVWAAFRQPAARLLGGVALLTLLLAWTTVFFGGGAYTGRYTAVAVPLVVVGAALGAAALPGRRLPLVALGLVAVLGISSGIPAAARTRTVAGGVVEAFRAAGGGPGDLLAYCPDQLAPPVWRLLDEQVEQVVYPSFGDPRRIDWVDYTARQQAADPRAFAQQLSERAGHRPVFVLAAPHYRTFEGQCEALLFSLGVLRRAGQQVYSETGRRAQILYRFAAS